jgi:hypothetical protein
MVKNPDFSACIALFNAHSVRYLIIGGHALAVHGHPRYTKDLDIWVERSDENAAHVMAALTDFGFGSIGLTVSDFVGPDRMVQLGYEPSTIDLLTDLEGLDFDPCYARRLTVVVDALELPFIDRDSLIANKRATGRPQDLVDADVLEKGVPGPP